MVFNILMFSCSDIGNLSHFVFDDIHKYTEEAPLKANRTENKSISVLIDRDVLGNVIFNFDVGCKNVTYSSFCSN